MIFYNMDLERTELTDLCHCLSREGMMSAASKALWPQHVSRHRACRRLRWKWAGMRPVPQQRMMQNRVEGASAGLWRDSNPGQAVLPGPQAIGSREPKLVTSGHSLV